MDTSHNLDCTFRCGAKKHQMVTPERQWFQSFLSGCWRSMLRRCFVLIVVGAMNRFGHAPLWVPLAPHRLPLHRSGNLRFDFWPFTTMGHPSITPTHNFPLPPLAQFSYHFHFHHIVFVFVFFLCSRQLKEHLTENLWRKGA